MKLTITGEEFSLTPENGSLIDEALGGLAPGFPAVLTGPPGSGRTVLCLELAHRVLAHGGRVTYLTGEPARLLIRQSSELQLDLKPSIRNGTLVLLELDSDVAGTTRSHGGGAFSEAIATAAPESDLVIIDPIDAITHEVLDEVAMRNLVRGIFDGATENEKILICTVDSYVLEQSTSLARVLKSACGSLLELQTDKESRLHVLRVSKSRAAGFVRGDLHFEIGSGGPSRHQPSEEASKPVQAEAKQERASTVGDGPIQQAPVTPSDNEPHSNEPHNVEANPVSTASDMASPQTEPDTTAKRPKILIVEDELLTRVMLTDYLSAKYDVVVAEDGFTAVSMVLSQKPDLLLLDLQLPRVSGFEVLSALRDGGATLPILVVSGALSRAGDRVRVLVLGANDMMRKPEQKFELQMKVQSLLLHYSKSALPGAFDCDDVEVLLGSGTALRTLDEPRFIDRVERACRFCEEYGLQSVLVPVETSSAARLPALLAAAQKTLRAEDAVLPLPGGKRAIFLLVSTEIEVVSLILCRLGAKVTKPKSGLRGSHYGVRIAEPLDELKDWEPFFDQLMPWPIADADADGQS